MSSSVSECKPVSPVRPNWECRRFSTRVGSVSAVCGMLSLRVSICEHASDCYRKSELPMAGHSSFSSSDLQRVASRNWKRLLWTSLRLPWIFYGFSMDFLGTVWQCLTAGTQSRRGHVSTCHCDTDYTLALLAIPWRDVKRSRRFKQVNMAWDCWQLDAAGRSCVFLLSWSLEGCLICA